MRCAVVAMVVAGCAAATAKARFTERDRAAVAAVLDAQVAAWNRGDLTGYMAGYAKTDALVFTSGAKVRRGWQATYDTFHKRYATDPKAMGTLAFRVQSIDAIGADGAVAIGEWELTNSPSDGRGIFSVVLERRPEGWRVIHDHTSVEPKPEAADPAWRVPAGWRSEVIPFPLDFAKDLAHEGFEDLRFPPKFFEPGTGDYWSYAFIWRTRDAAELTAEALADELVRYFRGLAKAVDPKVAGLDQIRVTATPAGGRFTLAARAIDAFKTKQPVELTGWAERRACARGALWIFVLAPASTKIRAELDALGHSADCAR